MSDRTELEKKWKDALTNGITKKLCSVSHLKRGSFLVLTSRNIDLGGDGPAIRVFEDIRDAVSFYRFVELPNTKDDAFGSEWKDEDKRFILRQFDCLSTLLDTLLSKNTLILKDFETVQERHNDLLADYETDYESPIYYIVDHIDAFGSVSDILSLDNIRIELECDVDENDYTTDDPLPKLLRLLDSGVFDNENKEHLTLARELLEWIARTEE